MGSDVPLCDILSVVINNSEPQKFCIMQRQSSRIRTKQIGHDKDEEENKMKNGYAVNTFYGIKPSIDILSEVKPDNLRKRKADSVKNGVPDKQKPHATKQIKVEDDSQEDVLENSLSEYEQKCRKNIEEKMAFFASLNFDEAKQDLMSTAVLKPKTVPKRLYIKKKEPVAFRRKSLRIQSISPEGQAPAKVEIAEPVMYENPRKPHKPLIFAEVFKSENQSSEELVKDMAMLSEEKLQSEPYLFSRYETYFSSMRLTSSLVAKAAPSRIFSVAIHPSSTKTLVCVGSKYGHLSFWDVESKNPEGGIYVYEPHSSPVNCIAFHTSRQHEVISSSYDGTVRCGHLESGIFEEVFYTDDDDDIRCPSFDFLSPDSLLVALSVGQVAVVDMRTPKHNEEMRHAVHVYRMKTVSVHPMQKSYFVTAGVSGLVSLWDLRALKKKSVADMVHSKSVNSAYFSPVTGNSVLTTSMDHKLCLFDTTHLSGALSLKRAIRHDNFTGRWLTPFRAVWLPNNEDAFIVGSMLQPRRIEVYQTSGKLAHNFYGEDLGSVCCINAFHPSKPILAGGNSSGKVHIFKGKD